MRSTPNKTTEPLREVVLGIPGAGKSKVIHWITRFFRECLQWEAGVQYQCLATQNTMAALIGGATVHTWASIPINATDAADKVHSKTSGGDVDVLFERCVGMRWLIIDEMSTLSAPLMGLLDSYLRRACARHPHAKRPDGSIRPFGGLNVIFLGDFWQLTPVRSLSLSSNPYKDVDDHGAQKILKMFWQ